MCLYVERPCINLLQRILWHGRALAAENVPSSCVFWSGQPEPRTDCVHDRSPDPSLWGGFTFLTPQGIPEGSDWTWGSLGEVALLSVFLLALAFLSLLGFSWGQLHASLAFGSVIQVLFLGIWLRYWIIPNSCPTFFSWWISLGLAFVPCKSI